MNRINCGVSKLFRAYELYNLMDLADVEIFVEFQSSFELTSYITKITIFPGKFITFQSSFELTSYITGSVHT